MFSVSSEYSFKIFVLGLTHLLSIFNVFRYSVVCCILLKNIKTQCQWTGFYLIGTSVMKELMRIGTKWVNWRNYEVNTCSFFRTQQSPVLRYIRDYWIQVLGLTLLLIFFYALIFFFSRGLEVDNFRLYDKLLEYIPHTVEYPTKARE